MSFISFLLYMGISFIAALLVNKCIMSKYEGAAKKILYAATLALFLLAGAALFIISGVHGWARGIIEEKAGLIEKTITEAYPENELITSGIDLAEIQDGIEELRNLLPESIIEDEGIFAVFIEKQYKKYSAIVFSRLESKVHLAARYAENGVVTLSSFMAAVKSIALSYCNRVFLTARLIVSAVIGIYSGCCIFMRKDIFSYNKSITFGGDDAST